MVTRVYYFFLLVSIMPERLVGMSAAKATNVVVSTMIIMVDSMVGMATAVVAMATVMVVMVIYVIIVITVTVVAAMSPSST